MGLSKNEQQRHAGKIEDKTTRKFIFGIIEKVYAIPAEELKAEPDVLREKLKQQFTEQCLAAPHEKLPNYKLFTMY